MRHCTPLHRRRNLQHSSWGFAPVLACLLLAFVLVAAFLSSHIQKVQETRHAAHALIEMRTSTAANIRLLSALETRNLRTHPNRDHVARGRALGVERPRNRDEAATLTSQNNSALRKIESDERLIISSRMRYGVPYLTHDTYNTMVLVAERFQKQLRDLDLPPHRILITSTLRTQDDQSRLRRVNSTAARGVSAHEFGTTADIHYERYDYVAERDDFDVPEGVYETLFREIVEEEMRSFSNTYHSQMRALLGRVMKRMHEEGKLLVTMERSQPVFHVTINGMLSDHRLAELLQEDGLPDPSLSSPG